MFERIICLRSFVFSSLLLLELKPSVQEDQEKPSLNRIKANFIGLQIKVQSRSPHFSTDLLLHLVC